MKHLLERAVWDADTVRDDLRGYVVEHLGDPDAILVVDEAGDVKKGRTTVGVQRQYTGTAGRIENAQVAVYLVYAATTGHAFIDRALYLPTSWTTDTERCRAACVPADVDFATKPALARQMITRALDAGTPASWVAGDEVYGADPLLRADLQARGIGYVLAVAKTHRVTTGHAGAAPAARVTSGLPPHSWQRYSAGAGAKGHRVYDWALVDITVDAPGHHGLLVRRNTGTGELAFYRAHSPRLVPLMTLVRVAGRRWSIEESFQSGKELAALDEHQVRRWVSWHRWTILAMLAHAFLSVMTAHERRDRPTPAALIPLSRNEIRRLSPDCSADHHSTGARSDCQGQSCPLYGHIRATDPSPNGGGRGSCDRTLHVKVKLLRSRFREPADEKSAALGTKTKAQATVDLRLGV